MTSVLHSLSHKLGVNSNVTSKASELNELLEIRASSSLSALRLTGSCRLVICLDLASKIHGCSLNQAEAVRLSSMTRKNYMDSAKAIARLLDLEERMTLRELALQFGCHGLLPLATDILQSYTAQQCSDIDFNAPMFLCAALIVAARKQKVKISAAKLRERSGVKKITFDKIVAEMDKLSTSISDKKKPQPSRKRSFLDIVEDNFKDDERVTKVSMQEESASNQINKCVSKSDYEEWKRKILANAIDSTT